MCVKNEVKMGGPPEELDAVFRALSDAKRREVLRLVMKKDGAEPRSVKLDAVAATEKQEVRLLHVHLPKLQEEEVIEWDAESKRIAKGSAFARVKPFIEMIDEYHTATDSLSDQ